MSFERALQAREPMQPQRSIGIYVQPLNKSEPCELPSSEEQLQRRNFRAYWDGQCKNGYAYGLGRDIAISDTHHVEEITIHDGAGGNAGGPAVLYDFVNHLVQYSVSGKHDPESRWFVESMQLGLDGFNVVYSLGLTDAQGSSLVTQSSPFNSTRVLLNNTGTVAYKFTDNSAMPMADASAVTFAAEVLDPRTNTAGGVAVVRRGNGLVQHLKLTGTTPEAVALPAEYLAHLNEKYVAVISSQSAANADVQRARQIEREYLYMACNGTHTISGLDGKTATKICTWRDQFKAPYEKALAQYAQNMDRLKLRAEAAEQQRQIQQQIALQQQMLYQQQSQQAFLQGLNALGQVGQQMQQSFVAQPPPQVIPLTPPGSGQIRCINVGIATNCRY